METRRDSGQLLWGILLVVLGLLFLAGNFGYGTWFVWDRWWPVLLILIGVIMLYRRSEAVGPGARMVPSPPAAGPPQPGDSVPPGPGQPSMQGPSPSGQPAAVPSAAPHRSPTGALILIGIGVAFLLDNLIGGNAFPAFVLIAIGIALLLRQRAER